MAHLLVIEDEPHIASGLRFNLEAEHHAVTVVESGEAAIREIDARPGAIDCVILDVMLPGLDGFQVASRLRARGCLTPILMLTARGRAEDVLRGFESGADDYLPKPFELSILVARVGALLRRHAWGRSAARPSGAPDARSPRSPDRFTFAGRTVDFEAQELRVGAQVHPLTLMEATLLRYLVDRDGQVVSRKRMLADVWNLREDTDTRAIDHFIARLRKYVEDEPARPRHVQTVRGVGYRFVSRPDAPAEAD
jgi:DNA-binding response OmpR family regulator